MFETINQLIFPNRHICHICNKRNEEIKEYICKDCKSNLDVLNREIYNNSTYISKTYYSLAYNRFIREQIKRYKYNEKTYLYKLFGNLLIDTINKHNISDDVDMIMYVPMHRRKEAKRGYNQSELLARHISKVLNISVNHNLIKIKYTEEQHKSNKIQRLSNLDKAFKINNNQEIIGKKILLIDDIITTGTTLEQCAKAILENGAIKVIGLALTSSKKM